MVDEWRPEPDKNAVINGVTDPAYRGDERTSLMGFLQRQRDLVAWKVSGAADDRLRSASTPSGMTAHGVVRHLTNVERHWFRDVFAGQDGLHYDFTDDDPDGDFHVPPDQTMADLLADYASETAKVDEVVATASLDDIAKRRPPSLRWIIQHMIEETARHLGHLDVLRERADGQVGEDPATPP
jgi:hypothetical protein